MVRIEIVLRVSRQAEVRPSGVERVPVLVVDQEPFHLFRYLDEQAFRFNERKDNDQGRFLKAIPGVAGKRLTYAKLTDAGAPTRRMLERLA